MKKAPVIEFDSEWAFWSTVCTLSLFSLIGLWTFSGWMCKLVVAWANSI